MPAFWWAFAGCFVGTLTANLVGAGVRKLALVVMMRKLRRLGVAGHLGGFNPFMGGPGGGPPP